ncbi:MAG: hypothetical protein A3C88_02435 [Candidatus Yanofskybacteria bacterium RIFCSPHIGHO2_02_FULL_50_12]|uniref:ASCH domain-containing protein n=1 Tax=Candidatus Yanofskybacteria bacterium RIFCSPHIGHO2_02_FULL_50_12 TaxID=1802685 RepID=A0A1F8FV47_9BACT|nr:MAG: hypothetical protein A3C88_02435 [Candidatus Yanofskybacteria bacterium RIFCSPHIGHO2_02_FULL_50_12]
MKTHVLRMRSENRDIFDAIKEGKKKVETRAASDKFKKIEVGDKLKFLCGPSSWESTVAAVKTFKTIPALLKTYKPQQINPKIKTGDNLRDMYYSWPGNKERIKKYGLIALELK